MKENMLSIMGWHLPMGSYRNWLSLIILLAISFYIIKGVSEKITTVLGGVYAMANPKRAMEDTNLDYVVIGEGNSKKCQILL